MVPTTSHVRRRRPTFRSVPVEPADGGFVPVEPADGGMVSVEPADE